MILLEASVRITVVAAMVALTLTILRVRSSGVRHAAWTVVLAAMLLMPILPSIAGEFVLRWPARAAVMLPRVSVLPELSSDAAPPATAIQSRPAPPIGTPPVPPSASGQPPAAIKSAWSLWRIATAAYAIGTILLLLRLLAGWRAVARLARSASPAPVACEIPVRESALLATPLTAGVLAPIVILPDRWRNWPAEKLRACLTHELAHIRRRDPLIAFIAHINRCVFWFHPLAWWLERTLAALAEDAADEAAVRAIGDRRRYAEVLLDIAEAVQRRGARVAWQGLGADGTGVLGRRVDRVLRGETAGEMSRLRTGIVFATSACAILIVVACREERTVPPLQPDAEVAERLEKQRADQAFYESAKNMTAADVDALEASLKRTREDFEAIKKLQAFYQQSGQTVFGWNTMIARRRPHILWMIDNHPEHELAMWPVSAEADPVGYAEARARWLAQTRKPDASEIVLLNAARFLARADAPLAEQMLLRAKAKATAPDRVRQVVNRLGYFYGDVIRGPVSPRNGSPLTSIDSDTYAREVRARLTRSDDAPVLASAGMVLMRTYGDDARRQVGVQLLRRAVQIDPQQQSARAQLAAIEHESVRRPVGEKVRGRAAALAGGDIGAKLAARQTLTQDERRKLREAEAQAVAELSDAERFALLPDLANRDYMLAESFGRDTDRAAAEAAFARSKQYAQDTVALAPAFRDDPAYGKAVYHATVALGAHALREGDKPAAVRYMLEAITAPPSRGLETRSFGLDQRLANYLLKEGERETVAVFLERSADLRPAEREQLLKDAAAIRAGKMPASFQYMMSHDSGSTR
jgi:beta-lactamase regulating signal transducer with metallopeptidase domain